MTRTIEGTRTRPRAWPVLLLALPAFVAIWGGWVGLGRLTGFGPVNLLPGIGGGWTLDTAITLPIGVEAYAAYALRVWLSGIAPTERARKFAMWSAIGSLVLGMAGQVAYHLMIAAGVVQAPWQITTFVSCLPVVVLGCGAALAHLLNTPGNTPAETVPDRKQQGLECGNTPETLGPATGAPAVDQDVVAELEARLAETPSLPDARTETPLETRKLADENASETTAERNYKRLWVAAAFVVVNRGLLETVPSQNEIARRFGVSPSHVSKVFTACREREINTGEIGEDMLRHAVETLSGNTHKAGEESRNVSA